MNLFADFYKFVNLIKIPENLQKIFVVKREIIETNN